LETNDDKRCGSRRLAEKAMIKVYLKNILLLCSFILLAQSPVSGKMYRWVDQKGQRHFSDSPPATKNIKKLEEYETVEDKLEKKKKKVAAEKKWDSRLMAMFKDWYSTQTIIDFVFLFIVLVMIVMLIRRWRAKKRT
jgi:hypothetical protein